MYFWGPEVGDFSKHREHRKTGASMLLRRQIGNTHCCTGLKYVLIEFFADSMVLFLWISTEKVSSSFTDPNDSQAESENNFLASYMMDVENDNVYIGRMTTDVFRNSGLDCQSEEKFGFASMNLLLLKYYELQINIWQERYGKN